MSCDCIKIVDQKLNETGHKLDVAIFWCGTNSLTARPYSRVLRKDNGKQETRNGKPKVFAFSFCPFCGEEYSGGEK